MRGSVGYRTWEEVCGVGKGGAVGVGRGRCVVLEGRALSVGRGGALGVGRGRCVVLEGGWR